MRRTITITIAGLIALSTSADFTEFSWQGGVATDQNGESILDGAATIFTILDIDLNGLVQDDKIDLSALLATEPAVYDARSLLVAPQVLGGYFLSEKIEGDGSIAGSTAQALIINRTGLSSISQIQVGDYIGLTLESREIVDLQPIPGGTIYTWQIFDAGDVKTDIIVVPEPSSILLLSFGAGGLLFYRRAKWRQQEQQVNRRAYK